MLCKYRLKFCGLEDLHRLLQALAAVMAVVDPLRGLEARVAQTLSAAPQGQCACAGARVEGWNLSPVLAPPTHAQCHVDDAPDLKYCDGSVTQTGQFKYR